MCVKKMFLCCVFLLLYFFLFIPITYCQELKDISNQTRRFEINLNIGYFSPLRESFRQYYGSDFRYGGGMSYNITEKIGIGADLTYTNLKKSKYPARFQMYSVVPIVLWKPLTVNENLYVGTGLGYYYAKVTVPTVINIYDEFGELIESKESKQKQWDQGVGLAGLVGMKWFFGDFLVFKIEGKVDYTIMGDPEIGNFGNVGGWYILSKVGMTF
ncbi:MAG: hypothetical protein AMJ90_07050 [candidate division Zixibacteria bacterium SM23_73_2]|nr:MAG: hypothetical protein AMJ90_07050 [candidate division Zixibacteria bacterium SM23_73_2]